MNVITLATSLGGSGALEVVHGRSNPHIDPTLHIWGWEIPVYLFVGGLVAGIMIALASLELRGQKHRRFAWMPFWGLILMSVGMVALFLDLEFKFHVWRFYTAFEWTSPMSWGSWLLLLVYPTLLLLWLGALEDDQLSGLQKGVRFLGLSGLTGALAEWSRAHRRGVLWTTALVGVGLGTYTGLLLGTLGARPLWNSAIMGPLFLVSGFSTGAALLLLARPDGEAAHTLVRWDMFAIVVELILLAVLIMDRSTASVTGQAGIELLLGGQWSMWFWGLVVGLGLLVPLLLEALEVSKSVNVGVAAPLLVLIGGIALRTIMVSAGQHSTYAMLVP